MPGLACYSHSSESNLGFSAQRQLVTQLPRYTDLNKIQGHLCGRSFSETNT